MAGKSSGARRLIRLIGLLLTTSGVILLLLAGAVEAYNLYAQARWEGEMRALSRGVPSPERQGEDLTATPGQGGLSLLTPTPGLQPTPMSPPPDATPGLATTALPVTRPVQSLPLPSPSPTPVPVRLIIPKIQVNAPLVDVPIVNGQWDVSQLLYNAGMLQGTARPGEKGNAGISGHVTLRGRGNGPFRWLEKLTSGDEVLVERSDGTRLIFRVTESRIVEPTDTSVLDPTPDPTLTLITCTDWDLLRAEYTRRLVVFAHLVSE